MKKTRDKLIEVARQLFAHQGVENTTMNDIAAASDKGRRTVYTYFRSKREIFNAVVRSESEQMVKRLRVVLQEKKSPEDKLMDFIFIRFDVVKELVMRNGSLKARFFLDIRKVERARRITMRDEYEILRQILNEGVQRSIFHIKHVDQTAKVMLLCLQGLDVPYIRDNFAEFGIEKQKLREYIKDFIINGIKSRPLMPDGIFN